jgi:RNA polymerase sigma factor (sigma-70 family)
MMSCKALSCGSCGRCRLLRPANTRDFADAAADERSAEEGDRLAQVPSPSDGGAEEPERWSAFHKQVEQLPVEEREVVGLIFYHGWTQAPIAELFDVSERTVRRR